MEKIQGMDFAEAVASEKYAYCRARKFCGSWMVTAYLRDDRSPTGVVGYWTVDEDEAMRILNAAGKTSPLSPTEGLNKSGAY